MKVTIRNRARGIRLSDLPVGTAFTYQNEENVYIKCDVRSARTVNMCKAEGRAAVFMPSESRIYFPDAHSIVIPLKSAEFVVEA